MTTIFEIADIVEFHSCGSSKYLFLSIDYNLQFLEAELWGEQKFETRVDLKMVITFVIVDKEYDSFPPVCSINILA